MEKTIIKKRKSILSYFVGIMLLVFLISIIRSDSHKIFGIDEKVFAKNLREKWGKVSGLEGTFSSFTSTGNPSSKLFDALVDQFGSSFVVPEAFVPEVPDFDKNAKLLEF